MKRRSAKKTIGTLRALTLALLIIASLSLLAGCGSAQEHRARQRVSTFSELFAEARERILRGEIQRGDSPEVSYIALGTPQSMISDKRKESRLFFHGEKLERWQVECIDMEAAAEQPILPLGMIPERSP